jgi:curli production assembly/transport component CsgG
VLWDQNIYEKITAFERILGVISKSVLLGVLASALSGCAAVNQPDMPLYRAPEMSPATNSLKDLVSLPEPKERIYVAVYDYPDLTGQYRVSVNDSQNLSRAVTQGAESLLIGALKDVGDGKWFSVLERGSYRSLESERKIIRETRRDYLGEAEINPEALPPLLVAGVLLEGGVIGYDSNTLTGGVGARLLGIGGAMQYRQNVVTVSLRAVSTQTGEVLSSVTARKVVLSTGISGNAFRFISFKKLLEADAGVTVNEPGLMALQQAIEMAVYGLVVHGSEHRFWGFKNEAAGEAVIKKFREKIANAKTVPEGLLGKPVTLASAALPLPTKEQMVWKHMTSSQKVVR